MIIEQVKMIIHILVDTSHVEPQDEIQMELWSWILYDQQQIQLYLLLQVHNSSNIYQNI